MRHASLAVWFWSLVVYQKLFTVLPWIKRTLEILFFLQLAWAPGKGVKGKEYKEYFDADRGVAFIPWSKLGTSVDLEALSEGGWIDPQTLPPGLQKPVVQEGID